jgi:predicted transglutaminase-like cysteine proteinase
MTLRVYFFCMYNSRLFHKQAAKYLKRKINQNVNREIKEITENNIIPNEEINISPNENITSSQENFGTGERVEDLNIGEPK